MRVLHLAGSPVSAFFADLSRVYARDCLQTTAGLPHEAHVAYVHPGGDWCFPADLSDAAIAAAVTLPAADAIRRVSDLAPDVMVPQLFCRPGMTHYRALFDVLGIPYPGNPPDVMALGADKARARAIVAAAGVPVPDGEVLRPGERPALAPPVVVKPVDADNSDGLTLVRDPARFDAALAAAFEHSDRALAERYVPLGREVRCGVLDLGGEPRCLPLEEYALDEVRTAADKLARDDDGELRLQAKGDSRAWIVGADDPATPVVHAAALACHAALGCRDHGLFDFRLDPDGTPWFLEAGLYCSFARTSVVATMARAAGIGTEELFELSIANARERA